MKSVRGLEELRTGARRHESNIQLLTTQLGEFRLQVQDQMNSIRTHFSQTVNEFYQKIVERQNAMGYRLSSVVDDLSSIKSKRKCRVFTLLINVDKTDESVCVCLIVGEMFFCFFLIFCGCLVRNIPQTAAAGATDQGGAADNDDDDPLFRPPSLDSR